jgi:hypothetical protein
MESDDSLLSGSGNVTDWIANNGGAGNPYIYNQTAADAIDNGAVTASPNASGGNTANYTPPSWLTGFLDLTSAAAKSATTLAPLINGQPGSPAPANKAPGTSGAVSPAGGLTHSNILIAVIAVVIALLFFWRKR